MAMDMMLVGSKVKAYIKSKDGKTSGELLEELNKHVAMMLDRAIERAKGNKRTTVKAQDV
jgi:histone H3/H4